MFPHVSLSVHSLEALLRQTLASTCDSPHDNSYDLFCMEKHCGFVCPAAVNALRKDSSALVDDENQRVSVTAATGNDLDRCVAQIAQTLHAAGCIPRWRNELLDLWTLDNQPIGAVERGAVRPLGLLTRAVHLNAWSEDGNLWVARRSLSKPTDPGLWDTLVGGLVGLREDPGLALERESFEEAGLTAHDLRNRTPIRSIAMMQRKLPEGLQREQVLTAECVLDPKVLPINQDGESMTIECLPPGEVIQMIEAKLFTVEASLVILEDLVYRAAGRRIDLTQRATCACVQGGQR